VSPEQLLGQVEANGLVVVADFEAGLGTLSRMKANSLDVLLVVVEPTAKSLEVARRALDMIRDRNLGTAVVVANRVAGKADRELVERTLAGVPVTVVSDDPAIRAADAEGRAPFDAAPDAPAVRTLRALAESLLEGHRRDRPSI
jgi:CO dehydrogenase maturation factor